MELIYLLEKYIEINNSQISQKNISSTFHILPYDIQYYVLDYLDNK